MLDPNQKSPSPDYDPDISRFTENIDDSDLVVDSGRDKQVVIIDILIHEIEMPTGACQFFYECESCHQVLKPKEGDCCVFCSYGSVPCPPIQMNSSCC